MGGGGGGKLDLICRRALQKVFALLWVPCCPSPDTDPNKGWSSLGPNLLCRSYQGQESDVIDQGGSAAWMCLWKLEGLGYSLSCTVEA